MSILEKQPDKSKICAIGDSLRTDMMGAKKFGVDALWNLDGINRDLPPQKAQEKLEAYGASAIGMIKGFTW